MIISICGKEEVSVLNEGSPEVYQLTEGGETTTDIKGWFKTNDMINCPVISYSLVQSTLKPLSDKESKIVSIKNGVITINQIVAADMKVLIVAQTSSGQQNRKEVEIRIEGENKLITQIINNQPVFSKPVAQLFSIKVIREKDGKIQGKSTAIYESP